MTQMGGLATKAPVLAAFFVAGTMASIGLPGLKSLGRVYDFRSLAETEKTRWLVAPAAVGIISAIYGLRAVARISWAGPRVVHGTPVEWIDRRYQDVREGSGMSLSRGASAHHIFPRVFSDYVIPNWQRFILKRRATCPCTPRLAHPKQLSMRRLPTNERAAC